MIVPETIGAELESQTKSESHGYYPFDCRIRIVTYAGWAQVMFQTTFHLSSTRDRTTLLGIFPSAKVQQSAYFDTSSPISSNHSYKIINWKRKGDIMLGIKMSAYLGLVRNKHLHQIFTFLIVQDNDFDATAS